jgi:hypothetical protein
MPISGTIWFSTFGLFGIGWLIDLFVTISGPSTNCESAPVPEAVPAQG